MKLIHFLDDFLVQTQARLPPLGHPDGAEAAILGTTRDRLDGREQIFIRVEEFPPRLEHLFAGHTTPVVLPLQSILKRVSSDLAPDHFAAARDDRVRPHAERLFGEDGGVNAAHDHRRALELGLSQHAVAGDAVAAADAYPDDVARAENVGVESFDCFVNKNGVADQVGRRRLGQHVEPTRRDEAVADCRKRRVDEYDLRHATPHFRPARGAAVIIFSCTHPRVTCFGKLPLVDGTNFELVEQLRALTPDVPTLIFSTQDWGNNRLKTLEAGAQVYLIKPRDLGEMLQAIHRLCGDLAPSSDFIVKVPLDYKV